MPSRDDSTSIFVVVPAFNEAVVLATVLAELSRVVPAGQVIVVDDGSTDCTAATARAGGAVVLRHAINRGQGAALGTGLAAALRRGAEIIVTFDADGQHAASDLPAMVAPIRDAQADVVLGTRFHPQAVSDMPVARRAALRLAVWFTRLFNQIKVSDTHNGFRAFSAAAARIIVIRQDRMAHASEILDQIRRHRLRFVECPVRVSYSSYSLAKGQKTTDALGLFFRVLWSRINP